jgi:putative exosortase-associated protein (TIGR04073 family)
LKGGERLRKVSIVALVAIAIFLQLSPLVYAEQNAARKLGRGIANLCTGWLEIPFDIARKINTEDSNLAGIFIGPITGFCKAVGRTAVGLYDIVTFPLPLPKGYQPVIEPELVGGEIH